MYSGRAKYQPKQQREMKAFVFESFPVAEETRRQAARTERQVRDWG